MYHPSELGVFWQESHWPEVRIYRKKKFAEIRIHVTPVLKRLLEAHLHQEWTYAQYTTPDWHTYTFMLQAGCDAQNSAEIRALNALLDAAAYFGSEEDYCTTTNDPDQEQLVFVRANNPVEWRPGACALWAYFSSLGTTYFQGIQPHPIREYVSSRMKGLYKIFHREANLFVGMRIHTSTNILPELLASGSCACLGVESNMLDYTGGFTLSPHNVDTHFQQCVLLVGVLTLWQRMRQARFQQDSAASAPPAMSKT